MAAIEAKRVRQSVPSNILSLSAEVLIDILCRLPVKTILACRASCKTLRSIIRSNPKFAELYFQALPTPHFLVPVGSTFPSSMLFTKQDQEPSTPSMSGLHVLNSCNGFLCLGKHPSYIPVMIFNPITGEYISLPKTAVDGRMDDHDEEISDEVFVSGFGCCPETKEYKVVRLVFRDDTRIGEVCTLGEKTWKRIEYAPEVYPNPNIFHYFKGVFFHGLFHWISEDNNMVSMITFDFKNEVFDALPLPLPEKPQLAEDLQLEAIAGREHLFYLTIPHSSGLGLMDWSMHECGVRESWFMNLCFDTNQTKQPEEEALKEGEILIRFLSKFLRIYDLKLKIEKWSKHPGDSYRQETVVIIPSFFSLENIIKADKPYFKVCRTWEEKDGRLLLERSDQALAALQPICNDNNSDSKSRMHEHGLFKRVTCGVLRKLLWWR